MFVEFDRDRSGPSERTTTTNNKRLGPSGTKHVHIPPREELDKVPEREGSNRNRHRHDVPASERQQEARQDTLAKMERRRKWVRYVLRPFIVVVLLCSSGKPPQRVNRGVKGQMEPYPGAKIGKLRESRAQRTQKEHSALAKDRTWDLLRIYVL